MKKINLITTFVFLAFAAYTQQTLTIPYQALVRDVNGNPVANQQIGAKITLLQDSIAGPEVFSEIHTTLTNAFGQMELQIGSVETAAFDTIDWSAGRMFINLEVDISGGINYLDIGTLPLLAMPYAKYAEEAAGWEQAEGGIILKDGKVGIGTSDLSNSQTNLQVYLDDPYYGGVRITNTDSIENTSALFRVDASTMHSNAFRIERNGNVKIGDSESMADFSVKGNISFEDECHIDENDQTFQRNFILSSMKDVDHYYGYSVGLYVRSQLDEGSIVGSSGNERYIQALYGRSDVYGDIYGNSYGIFGLSYARTNATIYGNSISVLGQGANQGHVTGDLIGVYGATTSAGIVDGNRWGVYSQGALYATNLKSRSQDVKSFLKNRQPEKTSQLNTNSINEIETIIEQDTILDFGKMNLFLLEKIDQLIQSNLQQQKEIESQILRFEKLEAEIETLKNK